MPLRFKIPKDQVRQPYAHIHIPKHTYIRISFRSIFITEVRKFILYHVLWWTLSARIAEIGSVLFASIAQSLTQNQAYSRYSVDGC